MTNGKPDPYLLRRLGGDVLAFLPYQPANVGKIALLCPILTDDPAGESGGYAECEVPIARYHASRIYRGDPPSRLLEALANYENRNGRVGLEDWRRLQRMPSDWREIAWRNAP